MGIPEAEAVVDLTLTATRAPSPAGAAGRVARRSTGDRPGAGCSVVAWRRRCCRRSTRSWRRLPWKRSRRRPGAPTLTSLSPNQGSPGHHGGGHADGHQFRRRRHDGDRRRCRRDGQPTRRRGRSDRDVADRQLRDRSGRRGGSPHGDGHDGRRDQRRANLHDQSRRRRARRR